jgi:glutaredoxin
MVKLFTSSRCPVCVSLKSVLVRRGIAFVEVDTGTIDGMAEYCLYAEGRSQVPLLVVDDHLVRDVDAWLAQQHQEGRTPHGA